MRLSYQGPALTVALGAALLGLVAGNGYAADKVDPIAKARALYNERNFEGAVAAAEEAKRLQPARADSADLIASRALLEHYRMSGQTDDLSNARTRLRSLSADRLDTGERTEWVVGLGELLYFEDSPGAAAQIFDSILVRAYLPPEARERVIDWWASALDRDAQPRTDFERQGLYQRIRERMRDELASNPGSAAASYWLAAAARGQGDWRGAWDAVQAGWVLASLAPDRGVALRGDLERLMQLAILPARARAQAQPAETLRAEWEAFKARWGE
jgi:hypothetical protein